MSGDITRLADRIAEIWYGAGRPADDAVAIGVIAGLCLLVWPSAPGPNLRAELMISKGSDDEVVQLIAEAWAAFWLARPELAFRCEPLAGWLNDEPRDPSVVRAAAAIARAAIKAGLWSGRHGGEDLLGTLWTTAMRSNKARQARGEFYTPTGVCRMMAATQLGDKPEPGQSIMDPCVGGGGMFLGAALHLRATGNNPHDFCWFGADISAVSVAIFAVNAFIWDLGPYVVAGVADTLAEGDWEKRAIAEQRGVLEHRDSLVGQAAIVAAIQQVERIISPPDDGDVTEVELEPIDPPERKPVVLTGQTETMF